MGSLNANSHKVELFVSKLIYVDICDYKQYIFSVLFYVQDVFMFTVFLWIFV